MNMKKKYKLNISILLIILLLPQLTTGGVGTLWTDKLLDRDSGVPTTDWYEVADWEIDFCMNKGGTSASIEHGSGTVGDETRLITHNRILSIQAERNDIIPSSDNVQLIEAGAVVYEIAWFVQPLAKDEDLNYEIIATMSTGLTTSLDSGNANFVNPARGYIAEESTQNMTSVQLNVWGIGFVDALTVDVV